jgi:hypothetical protein
MVRRRPGRRGGLEGRALGRRRSLRVAPSRGDLGRLRGARADLGPTLRGALVGRRPLLRHPDRLRADPLPLAEGRDRPAAGRRQRRPKRRRLLGAARDHRAAQHRRRQAVPQRLRPWDRLYEGC